MGSMELDDWEFVQHVGVYIVLDCTVSKLKADNIKLVLCKGTEQCV